MIHLLDKHITVVNALDTYFGVVLENSGDYAIFSNTPLVAVEGRRSWGIKLTASTGVDPVVFELSHWKCIIGLVKIGGKIGEGVIGFWPRNELGLSFSGPKRLCKVSLNSI